MNAALAALLAAAGVSPSELPAVPSPNAVVVAQAPGKDRPFAPQVQVHTSSRRMNRDFPVPNEEILAAAGALAPAMIRFAAYECEANPGATRVFCDFYFARFKGYDHYRVQLRPANPAPLFNAKVDRLPPPSFQP